uniref:C2H2-type domain-containing protein n=1 Tax=Callorhinchus milii TaxID=7868 RepID=A0A4W3GAR3_CALMI|eukprot:gi/632938378/ref/XP_007904734.1/ PREDICTED: zinc finger protein 280D isoform X3 [Callorhinchus milii]
MAELFMECEEEELEPWQKATKDPEEDDDELIFVGEITSSKTSNYPCNKSANTTFNVTQQGGIQNGGLSRGMMVSFNSGSSSTQSTNQQSGASALSNSSTMAGYQPVGRPPTASLTTQPMKLTQGFVLKDTSSSASQSSGGVLFNARPNPSVTRYQSQPTIPAVSGTQSNIKNGVPVPRACPKCNIHFNILDSLRQHMVFCCPDLVSSYCPVPSSEHCLNMLEETESGKLIMLVNDFYYGKDDGEAHQILPDQKTNTTFKCYSCLKILKNNIRFMNHMKHHMELEKQSSESWENHTTCQHCYRQFPTPFQLQCHIETAHSPYESTTICRICELSYESEQVLLQHMKDNHKPGEMPYVCQACNYRSSVYSDVDAHFRIIHESTKQLLCPFCLKVIKSGNAYVQHYMKHQKKGVYRCSKCKLQFLTCKEKVDHKTQHHRTFRKPKQLEGLPPGTKVTIRASMTPYPVGSSSVSSDTATGSALQCSSPVTLNTKLSSSTANQVSHERKLLLDQQDLDQDEKKESTVSKKLTKSFNVVLQSLRNESGVHKCIECDTEIKDFPSHFPTYAQCSLCRFGSSCNKSYTTHRMSFHTAPSKKRCWMFTDYSNKLRGIKLVCVSCPFQTDGTGSDEMAKHLDQNEFHDCCFVSESCVSSTADNSAVECSTDVSETNKTKKYKENQSSTLPEAESLETGLSFDGTQEKTDQTLRTEVELVEELSSPQIPAELNNHQESDGKEVSSAENIENSHNPGESDGLSELTRGIEKESNAQTVHDGSSEKEAAASNSDQERGFCFVDEDVDVKIIEECERNTVFDETKDQETLENTVQKSQGKGKERLGCFGRKTFHRYEGDSKDENVGQDKDPKEDVSFEQFFRSKDEPEAIGSDVSEQGSIQLEPLTPSEVLEHEATEILQKGGVVISTKKKGSAASEYVDENAKDASPGTVLMSTEHQEENEKS